MSDMLRMRTSDLKALIQTCEKEGYDDLEEFFSLLSDEWEEKDIASFNEDFQYGDVSLYELTEWLQSYHLPYEYFADGDIESDDYWEYYNPQVHPEPKTANYSKEYNAYLFKEWNLDELKHLKGEDFKRAVTQIFENPFAEYPALEELVR